MPGTTDEPSRPAGVSPGTSTDGEAGRPAEPPADGPVKVIDRRWWIHGGTDAGAVDGQPRKPTYLEELERLIAEKDKAIQAHARRYQESAAEFEQVRTRLRRDVDKEVERARRAVLADMLDVADNLDRAVVAASSAAGADQALLKGVQLVRDLLLAKLATYDVRPILSEGQRFDPRLHEAVSVVPVGDPAQDDRIISVIRTGYTVGDDVLRPSSVAVGRWLDPGGEEALGRP